MSLNRQDSLVPHCIVLETQPMAPIADSRTTISLLGHIRAAPTDATVWTRFVNRYGTVIHNWARARHLRTADAEDLTQIVLLILLQELPGYRHDSTKGKFRNFLRTITENAVTDYYRSRKRQPQGRGDSMVLNVLSKQEAPDDLAARLEKEFDLELKEEAFRLVELRVQPHNWQAFHLREVEGLTGKDVAQRLGMPRATVFGEAKRIKSMIAREIRRLEAREFGTG